MGCLSLRIFCHYFVVISYAVHVVQGIESAPHRLPVLILICLSIAVFVLMFIVSVLFLGIGSTSYDPGFISMKLIVRIDFCYPLRHCHGRTTT
jgi:hypothetical protein